MGTAQQRWVSLRLEPAEGRASSDRGSDLAFGSGLDRVLEQEGFAMSKSAQDTRRKGGRPVATLGL
jgi:hypothetical protein